MDPFNQGIAITVFSFLTVGLICVAANISNTFSNGKIPPIKKLAIFIGSSTAYSLVATIILPIAEQMSKTEAVYGSIVVPLLLGLSLLLESFPKISLMIIFGVGATLTASIINQFNTGQEQLILLQIENAINSIPWTLRPTAVAIAIVSACAFIMMVISAPFMAIFEGCAFYKKQFSTQH